MSQVTTLKIFPSVQKDGLVRALQLCWPRLLKSLNLTKQTEQLGTMNSVTKSGNHGKQGWSGWMNATMNMMLEATVTQMVSKVLRQQAPSPRLARATRQKQRECREDQKGSIVIWIS